MSRLFDQAADATRRPLLGGRGAIRAFRAGDHDRLTSSWSGYNTSPDYEIRLDLWTLRARSRQLARDNPWVQSLLKNVEANVVGPTGIRPQVRLRQGGQWWDTEAPFDRAVSAEIEAWWHAWGSDPETCSTDHRSTWQDLSLFAETTAFIDGDALFFRDFGADNEFGYSLRPLDADYLDHLYNRAASPGLNEIRMGVEIDGLNRVVAYHLWNRHPLDLTGGPRVRERIDAKYILHYFRPHRPNAIRGIPALVSAMLRLRMIERYEEAELVSSIVSSAKMGFISTQDGFLGDYEDEGSGTTDLNGNPKSGPIEMDAEPGLMTQLPPGYEFKGWDPQHPTTAFESFERAVLMGIAAGGGQSYSSVTGDLTAVNYSSQRIGLLKERDLYRMQQGRHASRVSRTVFMDFARMAQLSGRLSLPAARLPELRRSTMWNGRGWKWIDPLNDLQALKLGIGLGVDSRTDACEEQGIDYEENVALLAHEQAVAAAANVDVSGNDANGQAMLPGPRQDIVPGDQAHPSSARALRVAR